MTNFPNKINGNDLTMTAQIALERIDVELVKCIENRTDLRAELCCANSELQMVGIVSMMVTVQRRIDEWGYMRDNLINYGPER